MSKKCEVHLIREILHTNRIRSSAVIMYQVMFQIVRKGSKDVVCMYHPRLWLDNIIHHYDQLCPGEVTFLHNIILAYYWP